MALTDRVKNALRQIFPGLGLAEQFIAVIDAKADVGGEYVVKALTETKALVNFNDNTNETGYADFTSQLPAGALVLGWKAVTTTGFAGDTLATLQVGEAGNLNRFSAIITGSVMNVGTIGSHAPGTSDNPFCVAAVTPRLTVTGDSDFGNFNSGSVTVTSFYI